MVQLMKKMKRTAAKLTLTLDLSTKILPWTFIQIKHLPFHLSLTKPTTFSRNKTTSKLIFQMIIQLWQTTQGL